MNLRAATLAIALLSTATAAHAQSFALERFALAPTPEDGLALQLPPTLGHLRWSARLSLGYADEPFVSGSPLGKNVAIVSSHVGSQLAFALGLGDRIEVSALLPVTLYQTGEKSAGSGLTYHEPDAAGAGDLTLGASAHLLGDRDRGFQLGLNAALLLPTGSAAALTTDGEVGARGTLTAALALQGVTFAIESGLAYRAERKVGFVDSGSELLMRAGAYVPIAEAWRVLAELDAATRLEGGKTFKGENTPFEARVGGERAFGGGFHLGLAGGPGFTIANGTPLFRVLATLGYASSHEAPAPEAQDLDHDGIDGASDKCPDQPEDLNRFEDSDGCPDGARDGDHDGVVDLADRCPAEAEDANGYEDGDGCPDATRDSDRDGVPDVTDKCSSEAEDVDGVDDADGCPDPDVDSDKDGIVDGKDLCPNEPETMNGEADSDGCPDQLRPKVALPEAGKFARRSAAVKGETLAKLQAVLQAMHDDETLRVQVEGHASAEGNPDFNQKLSEQRAEAAKAWLVQHGIDAARIEARGYGTSRPRADGDDEKSHAENRRVEFQKLP